MDILHAENPQTNSTMKASNRTLSLDVTLEPIGDTSSTVVSIDPVGSLLLWTVIEAIALGFITTAAFSSLRSYHMYRKPSYYIPDNFYEDPYFDTIDKKKRNIAILGSTLLPFRNFELTSEQKTLYRELESFIFGLHPVHCSENDSNSTRN